MPTTTADLKCCCIPDQEAIAAFGDSPTHEQVQSLSCQNAAVFEIWLPPNPYDTTHACGEHLTEMIDPDSFVMIYPPGFAPLDALAFGGQLEQPSRVATS